MNITNTNKGFTIWELMIIIAIIGILAAMAVPTPHRHYGYNRERACFSNQRVLQGALEMYNMDVGTMMHEMNDDNQKILIEGHYIKAKDPLVCPDTYYKGQYLSEGDLCEDGVIYCSYHGTIDGIKITPGMTFQEYQKEKERLENERKQKEIMARRKELMTQIAIYGGVIGLISVIITVISSPKKRKALGIKI